MNYFINGIAMSVIDINNRQKQTTSWWQVCACRSDREVTIKSAPLFCIDIKHCDVYYAKIPRKHIPYSNAGKKNYEGYSFALGKRPSATTSSPLLRTNGGEEVCRSENRHT